MWVSNRLTDVQETKAVLATGECKQFKVHLARMTNNAVSTENSYCLSICLLNLDIFIPDNFA